VPALRVLVGAAVTLPFRETLEALRPVAPVDEETMRRVALAALRWVPAEVLAAALTRRAIQWDARCRLAVLDPDGRVLEDWTPGRTP
jgi:hypothetical protein